MTGRVDMFRSIFEKIVKILKLKSQDSKKEELLIVLGIGDVQPRRRKDRIRGWKQGDMFLAGQESRDCFHFIFDVGIRSIYLSLALDTAKFKQLDFFPVL